MIQIDRILCPIDYSTCSGRAFAQALALARWYRATVTVLHVEDHVVDAGGMNIPTSVMLERPTHHQLETEVRAFLTAWPHADVPVEIAIDEGRVADRILSAARERHADLIVMGIHGRMSLRYITLGILGSVTNEVIRSAPCPVLVVPPSPRASSDVRYRHILCPVDFGDASLRAVEYALSLAQESGATLVLLHVIDTSAAARERSPYDTRPRALTDDEARHALSSLVPSSARQYCRPVEMIAGGTPHGEILRVADGLQVDAIVMGVGARSAAEVMLLGSTADAVLRKATCPVLTLSAGPR